MSVELAEDGLHYPSESDPVIERRKVTMTNVVAISPSENQVHEAVDYVPLINPIDGTTLEQYVADAKQRWQFVEVSEEHEAHPEAGDLAPIGPMPHLIGVEV